LLSALNSSKGKDGFFELFFYTNHSYCRKIFFVKILLLTKTLFSKIIHSIKDYDRNNIIEKNSLMEMKTPIKKKREKETEEREGENIISSIS
jgi:hypothetical protein